MLDFEDYCKKLIKPNRTNPPKLKVKLAVREPNIDIPKLIDIQRNQQASTTLRIKTWCIMICEIHEKIVDIYTAYESSCIFTNEEKLYDLSNCISFEVALASAVVNGGVYSLHTNVDPFEGLEEAYSKIINAENPSDVDFSISVIWRDLERFMRTGGFGLIPLPIRIALLAMDETSPRDMNSIDEFQHQSKVTLSFIGYVVGFLKDLIAKADDGHIPKTKLIVAFNLITVVTALTSYWLSRDCLVKMFQQQRHLAVTYRATVKQADEKVITWGNYRDINVICNEATFIHTVPV